MKFYEIDLLGNLHDEHMCVLDKYPNDLGLDYIDILNGMSIRDSFDGNLEIEMSEGCSRLTLGDLIGHTGFLLILSSPVVEIVKEKCDHTVEYYKLHIIDTEETHSTDYYIVNPLGGVECVNMQKSELRIVRGEVRYIDSLVIDKSVVHDLPPLFRIKGQRDRYLFREDLVEKIGKHSFENIIFKEVTVA